MRILPADRDGALDDAARILRDGGIVIHATETCYGIACDLTKPTAIGRLFAVKQRPPDQPVSALLQDVMTAERWLHISHHARLLIARFLPGPLTIVMPRHAAPPLPYHVVASPAPEPLKVGLRISSHPVAQALAQRLSVPIATTSANLHGMPSPYDIDTLQQQFVGRSDMPDLVLSSGTLPLAPPSTVVAVEDDGSVAVLRQGALIVT